MWNRLRLIGYVALLGLIATACVPDQPDIIAEGTESASLHGPTVSNLRFRWDELEGPPGVRAVDVTSAPTETEVMAAGRVVAEIGILAVDRLVAPTLDGLRLVDALPPESSLTIRPDGTAVFSYWDTFDPRWHGRRPRWEELDLEDGTVMVDRLEGEPLQAKVASAASSSGEGLFVDDPEAGEVFSWSGELRYCFAFGRPVRSVALTDAVGSRSTAFDVAPGFEVRVSAGGDDWTTVWSASTEGRVEPKIALPARLIGSERLCIAFDGGDDFSVARRLSITVVLDAGDLVHLTRFVPGPHTIRYDDAAASSHQAVVFWNTSAVTAVPDEGENKVDGPHVEEHDGRLVFSFPAGTRLELALDQKGAPTGIDLLAVGGVRVLASRPGQRPGWQALTFVDGEALPPDGAFDWPAYRRSFYETGVWSPRGERRRRSFDLADATYEGVSVEGDEVVMAWRVDGADGPGRVEWILSEERVGLGGGDLAGVGMRWRVTGLAAADGLTATFPLLLQPGERSVAQYFRGLEEDADPLAGSLRRRPAAWFGESQSFLFTTGPGRTVVAAFDAPTWATVSSVREFGRDRYRFDVPLGAGDVRETPTLRWLAAGVGASTRWQAVDAWASVYHDLRSSYLAATGIVDTPTLPVLVWNQPLDDEFVADLERFAATGEYPEVGWFDRYTDRMLARVDDVGLPAILIQAPWKSDAEDPDMVSSFHAPRSLTVSPMLGGVDALTRLVDEAHRRGITVLLWFPSAYSIRSPLFEEHPDWLVWTRDGRPDDGGWGDILVVDKGEEYRRYAVDRLREVHDIVGFDGVWMDSWVGIAVPTDYSDPQPFPRLDQAIASLRAFTDLGLSQIAIEGLGPLGRGDAYGDYESYSGPPDPLSDQIVDMDRLRGREYLLYRIGAGVFLDVDVYERALAAGGATHVANLDEVDSLREDERQRFRKLNEAFTAVVDRMEYRRLLVADDRWVGVAWSNPATPDIVVFGFEDFIQEIPGSAVVIDVTGGNRFQATSRFQVEAHHVYLISG